MQRSSFRQLTLTGRSLLESAWHSTTRFIYPPTCAGCGVAETWMCRFCRRNVVSIADLHHCRRCSSLTGISGNRDTCERCVAWSSRTLSVRARYAYAGAVRSAIHVTKYSGERARGEWIGLELACLIESTADIDIVAPVPLADRRLAERGYNQSALIARSLARCLDLLYMDALARTRDTTPQVGLSAIDRYLNVRDAFSPVIEVSGLKFLLIDDVITTGSTLDACATALERAGASRVSAVTFASESRQA